jgi:hypothetical protein
LIAQFAHSHIHIQHNRPDIIILNKQQKQAYLLDIAVPNSHNITQTYNTKINKNLELSVAMRNLWNFRKKLYFTTYNFKNSGFREHIGSRNSKRYIIILMSYREEIP